LATAAPEPAEDIEDRDPGLARERTDLAWTRTAVSFAALGGTLLRSNPVVGATVLAAAAAVWFLGRLSAAASRPAARPRRLSHRRILQVVTAGTTLMSVVALALALLAPGSGYR
jgi:hypothetical protein